MAGAAKGKSPFYPGQPFPDCAVPWAVTEDKINEAVARIVAAAQPQSVIIFGSAARGEAGWANDLDLMVIVDDAVRKCREESVRLRRTLRGIFMPMDIVVVRRGDFERLKATPGLLCDTVAREGKVAYERR